MNWIYTEEAQKMISGGGVGSTPLKGVEFEGVSPVPEGFERADYAEAIEVRDVVLELFQPK